MPRRPVLREHQRLLPVRRCPAEASRCPLLQGLRLSHASGPSRQPGSQKQEAGGPSATSGPSGAPAARPPTRRRPRRSSSVVTVSAARVLERVAALSPAAPAGSRAASAAPRGGCRVPRPRRGGRQVAWPRSAGRAAAQPGAPHTRPLPAPRLAVAAALRAQRHPWQGAGPRPALRTPLYSSAPRGRARQCRCQKGRHSGPRSRGSTGGASTPSAAAAQVSASPSFAGERGQRWGVRVQRWSPGDR